jgi:hypothetical protein
MWEWGGCLSWWQAWAPRGIVFLNGMRARVSSWHRGCSSHVDICVFPIDFRAAQDDKHAV